MSASSSPRIGLVPHDKNLLKRRDRPPALDFLDPKAGSDGDMRYDRVNGKESYLHRSQAPSVQTTDTEQAISRSASATSSLDPYYFGAHTPSGSPVPPMPSGNMFPKTPDLSFATEPATPQRDPSSIDRRGLVGVGELATPRWARGERRDQVEVDDPVDEVDEEDLAESREGEYSEGDMPDSPWTIEAIDGEQDDEDKITEVEPITRPLRARRSVADESGGEEILYPRHPMPADIRKHPATRQQNVLTHPLLSPESSPVSSMLPPSSFTTSINRPKKRTSEEFEMDQSGVLKPKYTSTIVSSKDKDKIAVRRHRSLGVGVPTAVTRDKATERRRDTLSVNVRHARQTSGGSSSSSHGESLARRGHTSDFSHLPPSPSSSSIQQIMKHGGSTAVSPMHNSPREPASHLVANVAHSVLRGTQEGWSDLDDQTVEALRKLDGISKGVRTRSSVGGHSRVGSLSRPSTPAKTTAQWEGIPISESGKVSKRMSTFASLTGREKARDSATGQRVIGLGLVDTSGEGEFGSSAVHSGEEPQHESPVPEKSKKLNSHSSRLSFTPKRGSTSSTTYTGTPTASSRDSASLSGATSMTSVSASSGGRQSTGKVTRRNSAGSDISAYSGDAASQRDRASSLAGGTEGLEDGFVPPVPPLPKDFTSYKSPLPSATSIAFPVVDGGEIPDKPRNVGESNHVSSLEVPTFSNAPSKHSSTQKPTTPTNLTVTPHKTPSKKWSFSSALGRKLSNSPSVSSMKESASKASGFPLSPRSLTFGSQPSRRSASKEQQQPAPGPSKSIEEWTSVNADAMASATSLVSLSSIGSIGADKSPQRTPSIITPQSPDGLDPSRPETASSTGTSQTASMHTATQAPLSPSGSMRRGPSAKRLTPSSIPFFRRSSSQSMQFPPSQVLPSTSPTSSSAATSSTHLRAPNAFSPPKDSNISAHLSASAIPGSTHKKSHVLSLGLPSLLKGSSSRRSLHSDREKSDAKSGKEAGSEKEKHKKDEKDRSESRISVLMGRKRGKTLSSVQPKKLAEPVATMPPLHVSALPPATAQRVASLKSGSTSSLSSNTGSNRTPSRVTSQTVSSMQKQSDSSLRTRHQLPTIAGSPSVGTLQQSTKEAKEPPPSSSLNSSSGLSKETPTKIPRISGRSSAANSPTLRGNGAGRRGSLIVGAAGVASSRGTSPAATNDSLDEFGVLENGQPAGYKPLTTTASQRLSVRASPSTSTASRVPRQVSAPTTNGTARKAQRDSMSFANIRKPSTGSVASLASAANNEPQVQSTSHHRFSALSPSKGLKLLSPKMTLSTGRSSGSSASPSIQQTMNSSSNSRQSLKTPSPAPTVDEEELLGDEEMLQYIKRQQSKKLANGATQEELDNLIRFPEPIPPSPAVSPQALLKSSQMQYLSEYECSEILEYPSVYYIGANSNKKPATCSNSINNHGYDDERGDYLVIPRDHLAYRYEIVDTLGKGSFGQVLNCRDHCTGETVAIKIIRNKKRFHHQALIEIKILDSLRKWDADEKHHVIKMTEHFYFRNHLCIAMELLSINLYELIKANGFVGFTTTLIRRFTSQMLQSLSLMRHHRIVHCDLKPENILLRHPAKSAIKVIDFGSSCFEHEKIYTYIQSRFYRSPEVILGMNYHMAIDMWSLGCILAELYTGFPIFPGENEQEQLACIMEVLGVPDKELINRSSRKRLFFDTTGAPRPVVNTKGRRRRPGSKTLAQVLRCDDDTFVDFIAKCLVWDPERRLKPQNALRHVFITSGRRGKLSSPSPGTARALLNSASTNFTSSRSNKTVTETPKKSLISAPTPLTARSTRTTAAIVPATPSNSGSMHSNMGTSSRSYRAPQAQSISSYHSSRTMTAK